MQHNILEYWPICLLLLLSGLFQILRPFIIGKVGEKKVAFVLKFLNRRDYKVIHNVKLYGNGYKTQIDHIVVSKFGIFVIETKNYKGWILGGERSYCWTQVIYRKKTKFYNPILQNYGHVKALKYHLSNYPYIKYIPVIVFAGNSTLKVRTSSEVIKIFTLLRTIKSYNQVVLNELSIDEIFRTIKLKNRQKPKNWHVKV